MSRQATAVKGEVHATGATGARAAGESAAGEQPARRVLEPRESLRLAAAQMSSISPDAVDVAMSWARSR